MVAAVTGRLRREPHRADSPTHQLPRWMAVTSAAEMQEVINDGITNYNMRFLETTPEAMDAFPDLLLNGPNNAQDQLRARFGG